MKQIKSNKMKGGKKMNHKYILAFGFRRLAACKKLGHKSVLALIHPKKEVKEILISEIDIKDNTRLNDDTEGFDELMQSIKDNGLLQPIGVWKIDDLNEEDYITINLIENVHRKNITPYEMSQAIRGLMALGLNIGQIAVRLSQPKSRIRSIAGYTSASNLLEEFKQSSFIDGSRVDKKGKLPFTIVNQVTLSRISKPMKKDLVKMAKEQELSTREIRLLIELMQNGKTFAEAKRNFKKLDVVTLSIAYNKEAVKSILGTNGKKSVAKLIKDMLYRKAPLNTSLFE